MNPLAMFGEATPSLNVSGITDTVTTSAIFGLIQAVLPIVAVAILVGVVFYVIRWSIGLFRGI